jgi:hypothetical protein
MIAKLRDILRHPQQMQVEFTYYSAWFFAVAFSIVQIGLAVFDPYFQGDRWYHFFILSAVGLTCGCAGWFTGIVLSPMGIQAASAQKILAGLSVFWTGVIVGNITTLKSLFGDLHNFSLTPTTKLRLVWALGIFAWAVCTTLNTRIYGDDSVKSPNVADY